MSMLNYCENLIHCAIKFSNIAPDYYFGFLYFHIIVPNTTSINPTMIPSQFNFISVAK